MPRGTIVKVSQISDWIPLRDCFSSKPRNNGKQQVWFSDENIHDIGAV